MKLNPPEWNTFSVFYKYICITGIVFMAGKVTAQYNKNPLLPITNDGYTMTVEKFVKIPDDDGNRPRINSLNFYQSRIFVTTETGGKIYELIDNGDGTYTPTLFFNVKDAIPLNTGRELIATGNWHSGLRCVAFHPDFQNNGKFYTSLMEERPADTAGHHYLSDVSNPIQADGAVIEWTYDFEADTTDPMSYREVFRVGVPQFDHPMKQIDFNPYAKPGDEDYGLLYIGHGDGNLYNAPQNGGQNNDARGKIIRINPLQTDSTSYSIPPSNPFVNDPEWLDEIYATGFRNPHSLCFAKDDLGDLHLIVGNAGRDNIEEVDVVKKGENHGWSLREGTYVQLSQGGLNSGIEALPENEADFGFTFPAAQWSHSNAIFSGFGGLSIVGGYVYTIPESNEKIYLSADFPESGIVMYNKLDELLNTVTKLDPDNPIMDQPEELTQTPFKILNVYFDDDDNIETPSVEKDNMLDIIDDEPSWDGSGRSDLRFGRDQDESIYITSKRNGWIYKIQSISSVPPNSIRNHNLSESGIKVYPNPVSKTGSLQFTFVNELKDDAILTLYSLDGRTNISNEIKAGEVLYNFEIGPMELNPGYYLLHINSSFINAISPVIIQ